ncbi:MAG: phosphoenolpyruvate carboxykinase (ATP) [Thermoanaerobaculia bacterium]
MQNHGPVHSRHGVEEQGLADAGNVYWNLPPARLYEEAVLRGEARISADGALICHTGEFTGRSPNDKFVVGEEAALPDIWWGKVNKAIPAAAFEGLLDKVRQHLAGKDLFVFDGYAGADPRYRLPVRVITEAAWQSLFASNMFVRETDPAKLAAFEPGFVVLDAATFKAEPAVDGTRTSTFILLNFAANMVLIGGTEYAGEIKKGIFTVMNHVLPGKGIFPMHCSANYGADRDDVALFFGLSGTGKTTLSADPKRTLIGDDEHAWSDDGVFNIEGGCYAKVIRLSRDGEPDIWEASHSFGTIVENVEFDAETRALDLDSAKFTENTRSSYPITHLRNCDRAGMGGHPKDVVFLTCDAFGVLPPLARLTEEQAMYHFLSGYTAKVAGTERGVTEPTATFSPCFGGPFLPRHPGVYAKMLGEKLTRHQSRVWLLNTGWTGGPHGVGSRMKLSLTRRLVEAALSGELAAVATRPDPVFGLAIPEAVEGVPGSVLRPWESWPDRAAYDAQAAKLAKMFADNFEQYASGVSAEVRAAGPKV